LPELSQSELALLEALDAAATNEQSPTQRKLAKLAGLSLGMTNLLLKRMVKMGYVKVSTLNGRTLRYILTSDGMREKMRKSYSYVARSINYYFQVKEEILRHTRGLQPGATVVVQGNNELARLARDVLEGAGFETMDQEGGLGRALMTVMCESESDALRFAFSDSRISPFSSRKNL